MWKNITMNHLVDMANYPDFEISWFENIQIWNYPDFNIHICSNRMKKKTDSSLSFICTEYYFNNSCLMALVVQNLCRLHIGYHHRVHLHGHLRDRHVYRHHGDQKCSEVRLISDWLFVWHLPKFEWAQLHAKKRSKHHKRSFKITLELSLVKKVYEVPVASFPLAVRPILWT